MDTEATTSDLESSFRDSNHRYTSGNPESGIRLVLQSAFDLINTAPKVLWQIEGLHPVGAALLLAGEPGHGKSWVALDLALAIDQGRPWLHHFSVRRGKVIIIDEENAVALLKKRLQRLLRTEELPEDGSTLGIKFLASKAINLSDERWQEEVRKVLADFRPDLVIIDSLIRIHQYNENDAGEMARLFRTIKLWMNKFGCSFVFCHHKRKPGAMGNDSTHGFRGSSEIKAFVDTHLDVKAEKGQGRFRIEQAKARYGEELRPIEVEIADPREGATVVRYAGGFKSRTQEDVESACQFILTQVSDGDWHNRQEIEASGKEAAITSHILDDARKIMVARGELEQETRGGKVSVRVNRVSGFPAVYIPPETRKPVRAEGDSEEDLEESRIG